MAKPVQRGRNDWGYAIYRTVYTPESDALWPSILAKLDAYVHRSIWNSVHQANPKSFGSTSTSINNQPGAGPFNYVANMPECALFKNIVFSNARRYENQSVESIASHFSEFLEAIPPKERVGISEQVCLIIDDEVLRWLRNAKGPKPPGESSGGSTENVFVKAVDADYDPDECDDERDMGFEGWSLVPVGLLRFLYKSLNPDWPLGALVSARSSYYDGAFILEA